MAELDEEKMLSRIQSRYQANASLVLKQIGEGEDAYYISEPIEEIGTIQEIEWKEALGAWLMNL